MREWHKASVVLGGLAALVGTLAVGCGGMGSSNAGAAPAIDSFSSFSTDDGSAAAIRRVAAVGSGLRLFTYPAATATENPVLTAIQQAKQTIDVQVYMMTDDDLVQGLIAASKPPRNVKVRVQLEPHPFTGTPGPSPSPGAAPGGDPGGAFNPNTKAMKEFRGTPVHTAWTNPSFVYTHEKAMIVDKGTAKQAVWIMTANMSKAARLNNREFLIVDSNQDDIAEAQQIFDNDWNSTTYTPGPAAEHLVISPNNSRAQLLNLIDSATRTLSLGVESYGDPEIQQHLIAKAKARPAVQVQLLLADPTKYPNSPIPALARELMAGGVAVKYINKPYFHAKVIIADDQNVYTGSINFSTNSMNNNRELGIIYSQGDIVQQVVRTFAQDWAAGTTPGATPKLSTPQLFNSDEQYDS